MNIEDLGLSADALRDLIVERAVDRVLCSKGWDEEGDETVIPSDLRRRIDKMVKERIDQKVDELGNTYVVPNITNAVEKLVIQRTNEWGESQGEPVSFIEYLIQRADHYMQEQVNYEGKTKGDSDRYSWKAKGTRVAYLIDKHLQYSIENAMKKALSEANSSIVGGLRKAIDTQLDDLHRRLKVDEKVK